MRTKRGPTARGSEAAEQPGPSALAQPILDVRRNLHFFARASFLFASYKSFQAQTKVHAWLTKADQAAIDKLTQDLALEWGPHGIRVVGLAPGGVEDTEGMKRLLPENMRETVFKALPLQRFSTAKEMGSIAVFLVSEAAGYISGTTVVADGASSMPLSGAFWYMMTQGG